MESMPDILSFISETIKHLTPYALIAWDFLVLASPYLVGTILPPIIQVLNHKTVNEDTRVWTSILVCLFFALLLEWNQWRITGDFSFNGFVTLFGFITAGSHLIFKLHFKESKSRQKIQQILEDYLPKIISILQVIVSIRTRRVGRTMPITEEQIEAVESAALKKTTPN